MLGQQDRYLCALTKLAGDIQSSAMAFDDMFDDREPETGATGLATARGIGAVEALGQAREVGGGNAVAAIADAQASGSP